MTAVRHGVRSRDFSHPPHAIPTSVPLRLPPARCLPPPHRRPKAQAAPQTAQLPSMIRLRPLWPALLLSCRPAVRRCHQQLPSSAINNPNLYTIRRLFCGWLTVPPNSEHTRDLPCEQLLLRPLAWRGNTKAGSRTHKRRRQRAVCVAERGCRRGEAARLVDGHRGRDAAGFPV